MTTPVTSSIGAGGVECAGLRGKFRRFGLVRARTETLGRELRRTLRLLDVLGSTHFGSMKTLDKIPSASAFLAAVLASRDKPLDGPAR